MSKRILYRTVWVPSGLLCLGMGILFARQPFTLPKPGPLKTYTTKDRTFSLKHPDNWKPTASSSHGVATTVLFKPTQTTRFEVVSDLQGSLMADIGKANDSSLENLTSMMPGGGQEAARQVAATRKSPLEKLHEKNVAALKTEKEEFKAEATKPVKLGGIEALSTAFTFQGDSEYGGEIMQGKIVSALASESAFTVTCLSTKKYYPELKNIFSQMLASLKISGNGGNL